MNRKQIVLLVSLVALVVAAIGFTYLRGNAPEAATSASAIAAVEADAPSPDGNEPASALTTSPVDGTWTVAPSPQTGDFPFDADTYVGYRVVEELASIGGFTAVGRTTEVTGTLSIEGTQVTAVDIDANLLRLTSDTRARDEIIKSIALESATFPTSSFTLTEPIDLGAIPESNVTITTTAVGDLTLHGVTKEVAIPLEATLVNDSTIVVIGNADIVFADYEIEPPEAAIVLSIEDEGELELQLFFTRET